MTKEQVENIQDAAQGGEQDEDKRERSTIQFPYNDLDDAVKIAKAVHENAGLSCTIDQLAAYVKNSLTSGAFRLRVSNASTFGLTENERGEVRLTQLGRRIADTSQEAPARVDAFLAVPLYARIFENYRGFTLPGAAALEKFMREVGVSPKQTGKARQAFMRSAKQAGFFLHGEDRLVKPANITGPGTKPQESEPRDENKGGVGGGGGSGSGTGDGNVGLALDPLLIALLKKIPTTEEGWPAPKRIRWFRTFAMNVSQIYDTDNEPVEMKIETEGPVT